MSVVVQRLRDLADSATVSTGHNVMGGTHGLVVGLAGGWGNPSTSIPAFGDL